MQKGQGLQHQGTQVEKLGSSMMSYTQTIPNIGSDYAAVVPAREPVLGICGGSNCMLRC